MGPPKLHVTFTASMAGMPYLKLSRPLKCWCGIHRAFEKMVRDAIFYVLVFMCHQDGASVLLLA